ncbi:MAG: alpha/beta hydrolase [Flavobacteriaceae bacterium]|nr:alpha/beta hydrolase [Flavobacteriaceae bacterium]
MKKHFYFLKKKRLLIPMVLVLLLGFANSCISLRMSDKEVIKSFKKAAKTPIIYYTNYKGKPMRYIASKPFDSKLPTLLFLHGAPGSSSDFYRYLKDSILNTKANLISMDRLGYGYSNYGIAETSITEQAESAFHILGENKVKDAIVIGWSYGGTIAAKLVALHPELIKHAVLIAPAISPADEKYFILGKVAKWGLTRWMVPKAFRVAEDEKLAHAAELKLMLPDWQKIQRPVTYYQGDKDKIVPFANAQFIRDKMPASLLNQITIKGGSHFIVFKNYELIKTELLRIIDNI